MTNITLRALSFEDKKAFLAAMQASKNLHHPWVSPPLSAQAFDAYWARSQQPNQRSYLVFNAKNTLVGVFNLNEIIFGAFQNAFLGFYGIQDHSGKGYMSAGLKLVLKKAFEGLGLHRLEANIQPENSASIHLVKNNGFRYEGYSPRYLKINKAWRGHERWALTAEDNLVDSPIALKNDSIDLVPYHPDWPLFAQQEINKIKSVFPFHSIIDIQHVGSTAIPGLLAKPILDIQIAVASLEEMKLIAIPILQKLGYDYWSNNPDPKRMFFVKGMPPYGEKRTHHVHITEQDSDHWSNKMLFRDYLRLDPDLAKQYENLKIELAQKHRYDREKYTNLKSDFINKVLRLAKK